MTFSWWLVLLMVVSATVGWVLSWSAQYKKYINQNKQAEIHISKLQLELESLQLKTEAHTQQEQLLSTKVEALRQQREQLSQQIAVSNQQIEQQSLQINQQQGQEATLKKEINQHNRSYYTLYSEHQSLKVTLKERDSHFQQQLAQFEQSRAELKGEFAKLAENFLLKEGENFRETHQKDLKSLLMPFKEDLNAFKARVDQVHTKDAEQRIELRTELKNLQKLNINITETADRLASALQGQNKTQGNWGEMILENVLNSAGFQVGRDYNREVSFKTENGPLRPDVLVNLPSNKHLIIDAKTSLVDYVKFVNASSQEAREKYEIAHAKAVARRIDELSAKEYESLPGLSSPSMVMMFIPIESAYSAALIYDNTLQQKAIEKRVVITTPMTLLASLRLIAQLWQQENQNNHTAELAQRAEKFYGKLNRFLESMLEVGKELDQAKDSYNKALSQLYSGRGNLIKQASEFSLLGVAVKNDLPQDLLDKAKLELDHNS